MMGGVQWAVDTTIGSDIINYLGWADCQSHTYSPTLLLIINLKNKVAVGICNM